MIQACAVFTLRLLVRLYQLALRPILGPNCRYTPSCSDYALDALASHGAIAGTGLAVRRVLRCNPWCEGGHDPVPCRADTRPETLSPFKSQAAQ